MQFSSRPPFVTHDWIDETTVVDRDHPQHSPTNPILSNFRETTRASQGDRRILGRKVRYEIPTQDAAAKRLSILTRHPEDAMSVWGVSAAGLEHARRVLTRLANLPKESA